MQLRSNWHPPVPSVSPLFFFGHHQKSFDPILLCCYFLSDAWVPPLILIRLPSLLTGGGEWAALLAALRYVLPLYSILRHRYLPHCLLLFEK